MLIGFAMRSGLLASTISDGMGLRHTLASRLRQSGAPLGHIVERMGHQGLGMTRGYAHLSIVNLHEAVSRISTDTLIAPEPIHEIRAEG
jgi:site-specific recombinase XerD